jgi:hypothetical protein
MSSCGTVAGHSYSAVSSCGGGANGFISHGLGDSGCSGIEVTSGGSVTYGTGSAHGNAMQLRDNKDDEDNNYNNIVWSVDVNDSKNLEGASATPEGKNAEL